ncbi:copper fist DNA binding domain-containing protein [Russula earlei]|uniref:Copper fist DNA binding domain-containing protein n=1 Tax=Russula earlei TaxID=71964 RepID=A0ACC0ULW4_9AGAM|nr:copper fist DNA binding domain-containing protein [Russula earlei]
MVFINSQKFACESCIKGHRSSSCTHTERPLYEIKKKGRPVSQCDRCRQLRNTKRVHSKCTCSEGSSSKTREATDKVFGTKQKRYIPIVPALPNGLKDAFSSSDTIPIAPAHPRQKVSSLLNPCQCDDVWNCGCRTPTAAGTLYANSEFASAEDPSSNGNNSSTNSDGLQTLARAAAAVLFSSPLSPQPPPTQIASFTETDEDVSPCPSCRPSDVATTTASSSASTPTPALDLPPLVFPDITSPIPVVPPFSTFTTLAGSGCTCGLTCQCPDCATHHPRSGVDSSGARDCTNCVDQTLRVIDRSVNSGFHIKSPVLEKFFAVAERVPPPPTAGGKPVELPKLCCGGSCGCGGACGCSGDCSGCSQHVEDACTHPLNDSISVQ